MLHKTMISRYLLVTDTVIVRCSIHRTSTWESSLPNRCLAILIEMTNGFSYATGAQWRRSGSDFFFQFKYALHMRSIMHWTGDRGVLSSNSTGGTSLRNFVNSVYPTLPVFFGGDSKSRRSLLSGVHARGSKRSHTRGKCLTCLGLTTLKLPLLGRRMGCFGVPYLRIRLLSSVTFRSLLSHCAL